MDDVGTISSVRPTERAMTMDQHDPTPVLAGSAGQRIAAAPAGEARKGWSFLSRSVWAALSPFRPMRLAGSPCAYELLIQLDEHTLTDIGLTADPTPSALPGSQWPSPDWRTQDVRDHVEAGGVRRAPADSDAG
jgi:hypothetical protein